MPRRSLVHEKRRALLPVVARAFSELGYRRATTAELARRCRVQENILYRLWPDKKAMFIAAIGHVYERAEHTWAELLEKGGAGSAAERVLEYEARHLGQFGHVRIIFAGLSETDDPEIRRALAAMYQRYQGFVSEQLAAHRAGGQKRPGTAELAITAWAFIGLGTVASIAMELDLLDARARRRLLSGIGRLLLEDAPA